MFNFFLLLSLLVVHVQSRTCYAPDGVSLASSDFQPCIGIAGVESMCCGTNRTTNLDTCQPNGLCRNSETNSHFRDFCSDPTWKSPNCLPKTTCADPSIEADKSFMQMTQCTDFTWCCGEQNFTDCCNKGLGFTLADNLVTFSLPNATDSANASPATVTATVTSTPAPTGQGKEKAGVDSKVVVGVAVGLAILMVLGTAGGFWAGLRRGRGKVVEMGQQENNDLGGVYGQDDHKLELLQRPVQRPFHQRPIHEVSAQPPIAELGNGR